MAILQFKFEEEDLLAFANYHTRTDPIWTKRVRATQWLGATALLIAVSGQWILAVSWILNAYLAGCGLYLVLLYPTYHRWRNRRWHLRNYRRGNPEVLYGITTLELTNGTLNVSKGRSSSVVSVADLDRIEESPTHAFLYTTPISAIVIPRAKVIEGSFEAFLSSLGVRRSSAAA